MSSEKVPSTPIPEDETPRLGQFGNGVIPVENFMGDPRRVTGHPSNPANGLGEAFRTQEEALSPPTVEPAFFAVPEEDTSDTLPNSLIAAMSEYPDGVLVLRSSGAFELMKIVPDREQVGFKRGETTETRVPVPSGYALAKDANGGSRLVKLEGLDEAQAALVQQKAAIEAAKKLVDEAKVPIEGEPAEEPDPKAELRARYEEILTSLSEEESRSLFFYTSELKRLVKIDTLNGQNQRFYQEVYGLTQDRKDKLTSRALEAARMQEELGMIL